MTESVAQFALTRHLYCKMDVLASLFMSILDKDTKQSIFWTYEMYYSGWKNEVADYLMAIYKECFKQQNPKLGKFLERQYTNIMRDITLDCGHIAATMARNLADPARKYCIAAFVNCTTTNQEMYKESAIYVIIDPIDPIDNMNTNSRHFLKNNCIYSSRKDMRRFLDYESDDELGQSILHRDNWLYFASFSPIWADRIAEYPNTINEENMTIDFANEDDEEMFNDKYNYELDEQSIEVQSRILLIEPTNNKQMTKSEFIQKYGYNNKYAFDIDESKKNIKIKIRVTKNK